MNPTRLLAALVAYGVGVLLLSEIGPSAVDTIAAVVAAGSLAVATATQATVVAIIHAIGRPETVLAVLGPLAFLAVTAVVGAMVWPAILEHVPNEEPTDERRGATVTELDARRDDVRRSAA